MCYLSDRGKTFYKLLNRIQLRVLNQTYDKLGKKVNQKISKYGPSYAKQSPVKYFNFIYSEILTLLTFFTSEPLQLTAPPPPPPPPTYLLTPHIFSVEF